MLIKKISTLCFMLRLSFCLRRKLATSNTCSSILGGKCAAKYFIFTLINKIFIDVKIKFLEINCKIRQCD